MTRLTVLGVLAILLLPAWGCTPLDDAVVAVFGRSMREQPTFDPYENPLPAPEGAVPFAAGNLPAGPFDVNLGQPEGLGEALPAFTQLDVMNEAAVVVALPNPVDISEASLERGEELYLRFCAPCHGPNGNGVSGYIISAGYPPFPLLSDRAIAFTDGYLYGMIRVGRGLMPAYGHQISHFDRWHVVNYLRLLQGVASAPALHEGPDDPAGGEVRQATPQGPGGSSN
jgi:mono/diheme cytochrome c family protein